MPNIKDITSRIASVNTTQQITKAMKMVAAAKLAKSQVHLLQFRPYAHNLAEMLSHVMHSVNSSYLQTYMHQRPIEKVLLVVISSDKGLCGSFNANVIKKTWEAIGQFPDLPSNHIDLLMIGKKALVSFQKREHKIINTYHTLASQLNYNNVKEATSFITGAFVQQQYDRVELIYNLSGSIANQEVTIEQFLPFLPRPVVYDVIPYYIYEPSALFLVQRLIPKCLTSQLYNAILSSQVAEHGARMTTMSKATDNANNLLKTLHITYNKTRQAAITNEILEIAAGAESLKR
jgi:F-type H+-transporting ATPase subunit gamma